MRLGSRVLVDGETTGTVVRYNNAGAWLVFLDEPDGMDEMVWLREHQLRELGD